MQNIGNLPDGSAVKILGLEHLIRNVVVVYSNESGTLIRGEHRQNKNDPWTPIQQNYMIGNSTHVELDHDHREKVEAKEKHKKVGFKFPKGEFTTKMMSELNDISIPYANIMIRKNPDCKLVRKQGGKKGKPTNFYSVQ